MSLGPFAGITGSLKALRDIFPSGTDTKINRLDATISSRLSETLGARQIELNAVKTKVDLNLNAKVGDVKTKTDFIPSALTAGTTDTSRNTAMQTDLTNIQAKTDFIPSALTAGTTDTSRNTALLAAVNARQSEYSASLRHTAMVARTGIKKIFYSSVVGYGPGTHSSQSFDGSYEVDRAKTFIVPLTFGGVYMYSWNLKSDNKRIQVNAQGGSTGIAHGGPCIVIEFNG